MIFIPLAPLLGFGAGFAFMIGVYWMFRNWRPHSVDKIFRKGQLVSAALYSLGHGGNDAQKTMGIILACHLAMAIGTALGGWRIVKTMGMKLTRLRPVHGFCAETAGAATLFIATFLGIPVSTTHTIAGSIVGVGSTTSAASIRWEVMFRIFMAWIITIPFSGLVAAGCFELAKFLHPAF